MDEEVILKGSELYKYLTEQGYADFEIADKSSSYKNDATTNEDESYEDLKEDNIEEYLHKQIETILNSRLLFSEDTQTVGLLIRNNKVLMTRFSFTQTTCLSILAALASGGCIASYRVTHNLWLIPTCISSCGLMMCMSYLGWKLYVQIRLQKQISEHINMLQKICAIVQKILRFLRETEIISTGKLPATSLGSVAYFGSRLWDTDPQSLASWKNLTDLRKVISDELIRLAVTISCSTDSIKEICPSPIFLKTCHQNEYSCKVMMYHMLGMKVNIRQECILLSDLHKLNGMYLLVQSDYLKYLSLCFCPSLWLNKLPNHLSDIYNAVIPESQKKLCEIYSQLQLHYKIFVPLPSAISSNIMLVKNPPLNCVSICNEIHDISLQLYSLIFKIKEFEEKLEEADESLTILHTHQSHNEMMRTFENAFQQIKNSLIKTDLICKNALNLPNSDGSQDVNDMTVSKKNENCINKTNIEVGNSDFEIKTDDVEVYIGVCDDDDDILQLEDDQYSYEIQRKKNIAICQNVLKELKLNLVNRKKLYDEKEKVSLEKKGVHDINYCDNVITQNIASEQLKEDLGLCKKVREIEDKKTVCLNSVEELNTNKPDSKYSTPQTSLLTNFHSGIKFSDEVANKSRLWGKTSDEEVFITTCSDYEESDNED